MIATTPAFNCIPNEGWGLIYMYTFDNGKRYIGQTVQSLLGRHKSHLFNDGHCVVDRVIAKHDYSLEVLDHLPQNELDYAEQYYIDKFNSITPNGYNMTSGGRGRGKVSDETREKMSKAQSGCNNPQYGVPRSAETKAKISKGLTGRPVSEITRAKLSKSLTGRTFSDESLAKMKASHPGKPILNVDTGEVFERASDAIAKYGGNRANLSRACRGGRPTHKGYHWRYLDD